jgi:ABC-type dipeptide/oligopeptide/nickel transport system ATPase component
MSGGMNQRIALALVILMQQKLLLADEPTSALDAVTRRTVADELIAMRTDCGIAQMIVTHDFALASYVADRIAVMHCGRIVELAPAKELVSSPLHPYTRMLLEAVPALGGSIPTFSDAPVQSAGKLIEACAGHFVLSEV